MIIRNGQVVLQENVTDTVENGNMFPVTSNAVNGAIGDFVKTEELHDYYSDFNIGDLLKADIITTYNNVSNYSPFSGASTRNEEGYWIGYKHSTYGQGIFISRETIIGFLIKNGQLIKSKTIINLN